MLKAKGEYSYWEVVSLPQYCGAKGRCATNTFYNREVGKNICDIMRPLFKEVREDTHLSVGFEHLPSGTS